MKIRRVLVVCRKSLYQIYVKEHRERSISQAMKQGDTVALRLKETHEKHQAALAAVRELLRRLQIEAVVRWRAKQLATSGFDLVISLGGDGTLLDVAHHILDRTPLLGINTDPQKSVGALCCGTVAQLADLLEALQRGTITPRSVARLRVRLDGAEVLGPTLNDVLFAHTCPAGLTRCDLAILPADSAQAAHSGYDGQVFRSYRGSGIWVATATGSSAAIHSAGGRLQPPSSRRLQYLVREPYRLPPYDAVKPYRGLVAPGEALVLVCRMRQAKLWADGAHHATALGYSQQVVLDHHPCPLRLVRGDSQRRELVGKGRLSGRG